jgi:hypothetical protein
VSITTASRYLGGKPLGGRLKFWEGKNGNPFEIHRLEGVIRSFDRAVVEAAPWPPISPNKNGLFDFTIAHVFATI